MKPDIHLPLHAASKTTCSACGAVFTIPSTEKEITTEICSNCHPVYTGKFREVTSSKRVDKFKKKMATAKKTEAEAKPKKRKLSSEDKFRKKLEESRAEKDAKKKEIAKKQKERMKKAAKKTIVKKGDKKKKSTKK